MPEQGSRRGDEVTKAPFTGAFENHPIRFGMGGLNLKDSLDVLEGWARHTNLDHDNNGEVIARPGQTIFATAGTVHHSVRKLRNPQTGVDVRVWGVDTNLYLGASGALAPIDSGYSGDFLTLVPHRPPLSGDPWMFVADRNRMRKVRTDGLTVPIGLPAPSAAVTAALGVEYRRTLATFSAADATDAVNWIAVPGVDLSGHATETPSIVDDASIPGGVTPDLYVVVIASPDADSTFDSWIGIPLTRDGDTLSPMSGPPGDIPADDNDILHVWLKTSHPQAIKELRVYVVVSATFDATVLPGTSDPAGLFANSDAYLKAFRQNDFVQYIQAAQAQIDAAEAARIYALRDADLKTRGITDDRASWAVNRAISDPARAASLQIGAGIHEWFELGSIGLPLRRGDFQRIGNSASRDWSTITGLVVYIKSDLPDAGLGRAVAFGIGDLYLTGGYGPDTLEPGAQQYDYRATHYDPRTGAEGNPSPVQATTAFIDSLRRQVTLTPQAYGDSAIRQRLYRRGGSLFNDWFYLGVNTSDGGGFSDLLSDDGISAAGTVAIDHYQPVPTVDDAGNTILAQPLPALWGPLEGMLMGCGDPYRPGHVYWSNADAPDHWSATSNVEVCPPSEVLQHGGIAGHQGFVFSRERLYGLYPNLAGGTGLVSTPTLCKRGLSLSRWAFAVGPGGIYFAAEDGFFRTTGGPEEWLSREIQPLFENEQHNGLFPIDKTVPHAISVTAWENKVYLTYQDTNGAMNTLVYAILYKFWRHYSWGRSPARLQGEDEPTLLIGSASAGVTYLHEGLSDDGLPIACRIRTGAASGGTREEKLFGDAIVDCDRAGVAITVQTFLNEETVTNLSQVLDTGSGRDRYILDAFGESPQRAHSISTELSWSSVEGRPVLYQLAYAITLQPDITNRRVTNWDDLGTADEVYLTGVTFDCDTGGVAKTVLIERDFQGVKSTVATLTVTCAGRHKVKFSWPAVQANQVRVHPESEACLFWVLYRADWIFTAEPPRVAAWDIHFENQWDQYHTGLDLYCDTFGLEKQIRISVDNVFLTNDLAGGLAYWPVVANGRKVVHLTLPWGRGHVYHFEAIDLNPGLLYSHRWHLDAEPTEQANWIQNFTILGSRADKWLKAVIFECDTFGQNKSVTIEADGIVVETITVNATGRKVIQRALTEQQLGRVWRMFPVDGNPGRLYSAQPIFDEEPFQLNRWETQETNHNLPGWFYPLYGHIVLKSTQDVVLTTVMSASQTGRLITETYVIPQTGGVKQRRYVTFRAGKGVLIKYLLTSPDPFFLYRDETVVLVQPWGAAETITVRPFGNDDVDPTRTMTNATIAASTPGGSADTTR
jgi:hypothetical protein